MIRILKEQSRLLLTYQPGRFNDIGWLDEKLRQNGSVTLRRTFTFSSADLTKIVRQSHMDDDSERAFVLGVPQDGYYRINKDILGLKCDLLLDRTMKLEPRTFVANRDISVFRRIDELIEEAIIVGGESENAIPLADFDQLLKTFPTSTELTHYARSRIARVLKDYFGSLSDAEGQLNEYLAKKPKLVTSSREKVLEKSELKKFEYIHAEIIEMLQAAEAYSEKDWQRKILGLLLFIFPKYVAVLENVHIKDFYSKPGKATNSPTTTEIEIAVSDSKIV